MKVSRMTSGDEYIGLETTERDESKRDVDRASEAIAMLHSCIFLIKKDHEA
jgi:hypothetical protein